MKERRVERLRVEQGRADASRLKWQAVLDSASEFMATQKLENTSTAPNYKTVMNSLRRDKTEKIPKKKNDLIQLCELWRTRSPVNVENFSVAIDVTIELDELAINVVLEHAVSSVIDNLFADASDKPVSDFVKDTIA